MIVNRNLVNLHFLHKWKQGRSEASPAKIGYVGVCLFMKVGHGKDPPLLPTGKIRLDLGAGYRSRALQHLGRSPALGGEGGPQLGQTGFEV